MTQGSNVTDDASAVIVNIKVTASERLLHSKKRLKEQRRSVIKWFYYVKQSEAGEPSLSSVMEYSVGFSSILEPCLHLHSSSLYEHLEL